MRQRIRINQDDINTKMHYKKAKYNSFNSKNSSYNLLQSLYHLLKKQTSIENNLQLCLQVQIKKVKKIIIKKQQVNDYDLLNLQGKISEFTFLYIFHQSLKENSLLLKAFIKTFNNYIKIHNSF
ncbi:unnamed protein product [Paramecium pentaurelia]|uniref:Uncharacterized protein n=1 Tax=Paramecium pentaurelia TaxID=43138 RepID=A0A8S1VSY1_9CILI|nr:unnamed protein product [Paramecium pentaurelia]